MLIERRWRVQVAQAIALATVFGKVFLVSEFRAIVALLNCCCATAF
jgi:hypothetical protein